MSDAQDKKIADLEEQLKAVGEEAWRVQIILAQVLRTQGPFVLTQGEVDYSLPDTGGIAIEPTQEGFKFSYEDQQPDEFKGEDDTE